MNIIHDYTYISNGLDNKLLLLGYAQLSVYSIHFSRRFVNEQIEVNKRASETLHQDEWGIRMETLCKEIGVGLSDLAYKLNEKYDIHQIDKEKSTSEHYRSDWDLFFWSNKGWNNKDYIDTFSLNLNRRRTVEANAKLVQEILEFVGSIDINNVECRVQYSLVVDEKRVQEDALKEIHKVLGQFVVHNGMFGKYRLISANKGNEEYGFFRKGSKSKFYSIDMYQVLEELKIS